MIASTMQRLYDSEINATERQREIAQGLRDEHGSLIGGLHFEDYVQGHRDYDAGAPPPRVTSVSYDLGRRRAARLAEAKADMMARLKADQERSRAAVRKMIAHLPDVLAEFDAKMAELDNRNG